MKTNNSYLYIDDSEVCKNLSILQSLTDYADKNCTPIYVLSAPLTERKYKSSYPECCVILIPKHKITFINCGSSDNDFDDYVSDTLEDVGSISDRFQFKEKIGQYIYRNNIYERKNINKIDDNFED